MMRYEIALDHVISIVGQYLMKEQKKLSKEKIDLIVIGNPNSGKTSLIRRFVQGETAFSHFYTPTLGLSLEKKLMRVDNSEVTVCIWDTAGQQKFLSLTNSYYKKADGVLVVFDLTDKNTFERVDKFWVPELREKSNRDCPQILIGNKCDMAAEREVTKELGQQLGKAIDMPYFETSAKTGEGVESAIQSLVRQCLSNVKSEAGVSLQLPQPQRSCMAGFKGFFSDLAQRFK